MNLKVNKHIWQCKKFPNQIFEVEMWFPAFLFSESIEFCLKLKGYLQGILSEHYPKSGRKEC